MPVPLIPGVPFPPTLSFPDAGVGYQQITRGQFRTRVLEQLGDAGPIFWTTDELNGIIQEALRVFNSLTGFWRGRQLITTYPDLSWYTIAGTITSSLRVTFNDHPLLPVALVDLDAGQQFWESENTSSGGVVPTEPQMYGIGALNLIAIWPSDHDGGNRLQVDGIASTPILSADTDFVNIGTEEMNCLLDYCTHIALFKEGGAEFAATLPGKDNPDSLFGSFLQGCASRNAMLARSEIYRKWLGGDSVNQEKNPLRHAARLGAR